jgi:rhodanese-related sulfurtransferase
MMLRRGYKRAYALKGGIRAWVMLGYPTERGAKTGEAA